MPSKLLNHIKSNPGFTLIELLIVIAIIVIVVAVGAASYTTVAKNSRNTDRQAEIERLAIALEEYRADHGSYIPTGTTGSYWGIYGGEFEGVGVYCGIDPSQKDRLCCLHGGTIASTFIDSDGWTCPQPWNTYISDDLTFKQDVLYNDPINPTREIGSYHYASDGRTFALVARHYEGTPPVGHRLSDSKFYECEAKKFQAFDWTNGYFTFSPEVRQPTATEKNLRPGWSSCT